MRIRLLDVCLPDYFLGTSDPVVAIPLSSDLSLAQIRDAIRRAISEEQESLGDIDPIALRQRINLELGSLLLRACRDLPSDEERCGDPVYAYVAVLP